MVMTVEDERRLALLAELALLEAPLDPLLEQLCDLARSCFGVHTAFVSLIDATERHIIAHSGLDLGRLPREETMCNVVILGDDPLIIEDAHEHPVLSRHPLVTDEPRLRFYASLPLALTPGLRFGTFCMTDSDPRVLSGEQIATFRGLATLVAGQIAHHRGKRLLASQTRDLWRKQAILSQTATFAKVGGFEADPADGTMVWSDELHRLFGVRGDVAQTCETFLALFKDDGQRQLRQGLSRLVAGARDLDIETTFDGGGGARRYVHIHAERREDDGGSRIVGIVQDVTERRGTLEAVRWIASHDSLTKLVNRKIFHERIEAAVTQALPAGQRLALIMLDIDRFKTINDSLGHDAGDAVLVAVAERLTAVVGTRGIAARIGGDEFAVLIVGLQAEGMIAMLATAILQRLREPLAYGSHELSTRATLGIVISQVAGTETAASLFKDADLALYNAKAAGRDGVAFYRPAMRVALEQRLDKLAKARAALSFGRIEPYYQPKVCLESGKLHGFEALLRFVDPDDGLCGPDALGDAFKDADLAVALGRAMLRRVVGDLCAWRDQDVAVGTIAINVAEPEFYAGTYAEGLLGVLADAGLPPAAIEVEITESVFLGHGNNHVGTTLNKLASAGVAVALDDFGTGYASLTHLKRYPVRTIKIDRSFVAGIETDPGSATIVDAVTSLANSLRIGVVAEGVETREQVAFLRERRCAIGQGYLFAKPMAASRVAHFVRTWTASRHDEPRRAIGK